jgi:signal peptidase I
MQVFTSLVLLAFVGYGAAWYLGAVTGNFSLLLLLATLVTGAYWVAERWLFLPRRRQAAAELEAAAEQRRQTLAAQGITQVDTDVTKSRDLVLAQPWWLDWTAGLFPVILMVFLLRSFLFEPFKIPSGSMVPTLLVGDLILVNKYHYGVRLPVVGTKLTDGEPVQRGDVMVFKYPPQPNLDYIKRVVGLPGDEVAYLNKRLSINGKAVPVQPLQEFFDSDAMRYAKQFEESLGAKPHRLIIEPDRPAFIPGAEQFPFNGGCAYTVEGVVCKVPAGHYFVMGDNRDNSLDSRFWGFVPDSNIVGKAFMVWMNFGDLKRIGWFN